MGLMPDARKPKETVNYRHNEKCLTCDYFFPSGNCSMVDGVISPEMVCDLYAVKSSPQYRDKQFFEQEYTKSQNRGK